MRKTLLSLLLATVATAHAENILGKTIPFSRSQACQQVKCKLLSETKVGPYVVYTYTGKTGNTNNTDAEGGNYFSIKRNEKNVALGIYYVSGGGAGDYEEQFAQIEAPNIARLLGLKAPDAKANKAARFSFPVGQDILLSNKSAREAISVVYAVQKSEAGAVAALLNRADPEGKKRVIADFKKLIGAVGECRYQGETVIGYKDKNGQPIKMNDALFAKVKKWEDDVEKHGMVWLSGMDTGELAAPGLSSTSISPTFYVDQVKNSPERFKQQLCLK